MQIFVAMPLGKKEIASVRPTIREAVGRAGFTCVFPDEIPGHGEILTDVMDEIARSSAVIVEITDHNPNVIWEYGWASALGKPAFPISKSARKIFFDRQQARTIVYNVADMDTTLGQPLTIWCERLKKSGPEIPPVNLFHTKEYGPISSEILGLNTVTDTEFGYFDLVRRAKRRFFCVAQNHHYLVHHVEQFKDSIEEFFGDDARHKRFDMLMSDPAVDYGVQAWISLSAPEYQGHLEHAATVLDEVVEWARSRPRIGDRFKLRKAPLVPISMNFVDPEDSDGLVVVTPSFLKVENVGRHCLVISKLNNAPIFFQYWSWANGVFTWREP